MERGHCLDGVDCLGQVDDHAGVGVDQDVLNSTDRHASRHAQSITLTVVLYVRGLLSLARHPWTRRSDACSASLPSSVTSPSAHAFKAAVGLGYAYAGGVEAIEGVLPRRSARLLPADMRPNLEPFFHRLERLEFLNLAAFLVKGRPA